MRYISTRASRTAQSLSFMDTVLAGLAPDGGLYVPESYPRLYLEALRGQSYQAVAFEVLGALAPDISPKDLREIIDGTYTAETFGSREITPLREVVSGLWILGLSNGPTLAFKDVALQLLGRLMEYALKKSGGELNILGATSGDTGSAAEYAIRGRKSMRIFMLSPFGRMSPFQTAQMYTLNEPNVFNLAVDGTFDDCQRLVKAVNADAEFKARMSLGAVNSINWARIAAQVVYYVYAYLQVTSDNRANVDFAVPSGNFGNALAAHVARQMGVPIRCIIVATNENDVLDRFFATGYYRVRKSSDVVATTSPSMDIAEASNFERLVYDMVRAKELVRDLWGSLAMKGEFDGRFIQRRLEGAWLSGRASEADVDRMIREMYREYGEIIDPHTAVAMYVGTQHRTPRTPLIVAETAQAAKFSCTISRAIGVVPPVPAGYEGLAHLPQHVTRIAPDAQVVKDFIAANAQ